MSITFTIERYNDGLAYGPLIWEEKNLRTGAFSGPYGRKELPSGLYHAYRRKLLDKPGKPAFCDSLNNCWFQVIDPQFSTTRTELGVHPDGNKVGTKGCIGILEADSSQWYSAFESIEAGSYTPLIVDISISSEN